MIEQVSIGDEVYKIYHGRLLDIEEAEKIHDTIFSEHKIK